MLGEVRGVRTRKRETEEGHGGALPLREGMAGKGSTCHQKHGDDDDNKPPPLEKVELLGGTADAAGDAE